MAIDLTNEQRETGKENFARTAEGLARLDAAKNPDPTRRTFMKGMLATAGAGALTAAGYFGYQSIKGTPVKAAIIGCGDEGGVLVGAHNPEYLEFIACCDIRPTNLKRIYDGDPKAAELRKGFKKIYGKDAAKNIRQYRDYDTMLKENKEIEVVVIAVPLHLHAKVAIDCMNAGGRPSPIHVLCEKLMAWNVSQCKKMIAVAKSTGSILSIGHQRHYSLLYAQAHEVIKSGVLGDIKHIRAQWHRNNTWPYQASETDLPLLVPGTFPQLRDGWFPSIYQEDYDALKDSVTKYHYDSVEQLVRWRLYNDTGNGLMAELGSHQLDACSIFLGKVHPLSVTGVGGTFFYGHRNDKGEIDRRGPNARQSDDHVFVTFEFPGPNHPKGAKKGSDKDDIVVVTYSSINTNGLEPYGETVMGTRGTLTVELEAELKLFAEKDPRKKQGDAKGLAVGVSSAGGVALDSSSTWGPAGARPAGTAVAVPGEKGPVVSRGYREEMEDFAYCVHLLKKEKHRYEKKDGEYTQRLPHCHGEVAMADAIIALTSNLALKGREIQVPGSSKPVKVTRIDFEDNWFNAESKDVPDGHTKPKVPVE